jgi:O-antigen/teichoic acid export membrane protein
VIATADVGEALVYYVWALVTVAIGWGVWGLATAVVVRAFAGTVIVTMRGPLGVLRPRWSWSTVRPFIGFGAKYQASTALLILREQGLNVVVASVAGLGTLGIWNLAWRVLQIPALLFQTVGRVVFPAMSRLLGANHDPRTILERTIAGLAVLTGVVTVALIGFAPALPALIGERWADVPEVILWSGCAVTFAAPTVVPMNGYLLAAGRAGIVAVATLVSGLVWFVIAAVLLPDLGAPAVGIGWIGAAVFNSGILWRQTVALSGAAVLHRVAGPWAAALSAAAVAWLVASQPSSQLLGGLLGLVTGELVLVVGLALLARPAVRDAHAMGTQALGTFRRKRSAVPAAAVES